jgi:hypothetical protein
VTELVWFVLGFSFGIVGAVALTNKAVRRAHEVCDVTSRQLREYLGQTKPPLIVRDEDVTLIRPARVEPLRDHGEQ